MPAQFGRPVPFRLTSTESVAIVEPTLGLSVDQPSVDEPLGSTPNSDNFIMRDGALEPRPMLSLRNTTPQPFGNDTITGVYELQSVAAVRYPLASGSTRWAAYGLSGTPNGWSVLSYVSSNGLNDPPSLAATDKLDWTTIYYPLKDANLAVAGSSSYQSLYCTASNTTVFSSLTGGPQARTVTGFDNYLLAGNIRTSSVDLVQRIQWSDRGDPSAWTTGLSGFQDLLAMKGQILRMIGQENRVVIFSEDEIWQGLESNDVDIFSFQPYDRTIGCPYPRTITKTPKGVIFLAKDYNVYLLPKYGGPAQPIGQRLHRSIRNTIDHPDRAWGVYDNTYGQYKLHYAIKGGSGQPQRAVYLDIESGSWAPQSYDASGGNIALTAGHEIYVSSSATTWGGLSAASIPWASLTQSWGDLEGTSEERSVLVGSSNGTLYTHSSTATSDNGTAVSCFWTSSGLAGEDFSHQKVVTEFRVDYQGDSASSLTLRFSANQGATYGLETQLDLPATSQMSQTLGSPYLSARYPSFQVLTENARPRLFRFHVKFRRGGR